MFIDKFGWKPFYAPDDEAGAGEEIVETEGGDEGSEGTSGESQEQSRVGLRQQLERAADDSRKADLKKDKKSGRFAKGGPRAERDAGETEPVEGEPPVEGEQTAPVVAPPEGFPREAIAEWNKTPPVVQAAIVKRVQDMNKGVQELKTKYTEIDKAIEPHTDALRQFNVPPAQAIDRLFLWFKSLANNPGVAFPALAKSFNYDWKKIAAIQVDGQPGQQGQGNAQQSNGPGDIPEPLQRYVDNLKQEINGLKAELGTKVSTLEQSFTQQSEAKTNEILQQWAKDKPYYEDVRVLMAQLIQSGAVPLKDGQVDLDGAYNMATRAHDGVFAKLTADQQAAAVKAQKDKAAADVLARKQQVEQARRAGSSLNGGAPGIGNLTTQNQRKPGQKPKSVRESILEAKDQLSN